MLTAWLFVLLLTCSCNGGQGTDSHVAVGQHGNGKLTPFPGVNELVVNGADTVCICLGEDNGWKIISHDSKPHDNDVIWRDSVLNVGRINPKTTDCGSKLVVALDGVRDLVLKHCGQVTIEGQHKPVRDLYVEISNFNSFGCTAPLQAENITLKVDDGDSASIALECTRLNVYTANTSFLSLSGCADTLNCFGDTATLHTDSLNVGVFVRR